MKGWRTITFNVVTGLIALANAWTGTGFIDEQILIGVIVIGNGILRFITDTAVGQSR